MQNWKWRSQNAQKVTRLLDQAMVLFNYDPFQNENFSFKRKEFTRRWSEFFPIRAVPYVMINHFYHIGLPLLNVAIFMTHVGNCVIGATPMNCTSFWIINLKKISYLVNEIKLIYVFYFRNHRSTCQQSTA